MEKMIAFCGIVCTECEAYKATQADDLAALERVAAAWSEQFKPGFTAASITCDGCLATTERLCSYCAVCSMRVCAEERGEQNCAFCADYQDCQKLKEFFTHAPHMRTVLDEMRAAG